MTEHQGPPEEQPTPPAPPPAPPPASPVVPPPMPWQRREEEPAAPPEAPPEPPAEPAEFPPGFWRRVDYVLHHPEAILESLRRDLDLWRMATLFLFITLGMAALYGAVMGATNLLQASDMPAGGKFLMILTSAVKVPVLFLGTLLIIVWPVYVGNTFVGPRLGFAQISTVLLASVAITAIVLASTASVAFFFAVTDRNYHFMKLLNVFFFAYSALVGLRFFRKAIAAATPVLKRRRLKLLFVATLVLYAFVGMELAWVLRPFIGEPGRGFKLFRERKGSFYESVWESTTRLLGKRPSEAQDQSGPGTGREPQEDEQDSTLYRD